MRADPTVGLVVVGYESEDEWELFFDSLKNSKLIPGHVVIVDNSPPGALTISEAVWDGLVVIRRPDNPGYGSAINAGVAELPKLVTHVVLSNPDIRFMPNTLLGMKAGFEAFPDTAVTGPALVNADGSIYPSARAIPGVRIGIGHALLGNIWPKNPWTRRYLGGYQEASERSVGWVSGALMMVTRSSFEEIKGFDPGYFMFFEDVDLCYRLKKAGYRTVYVPDAQALHEGAHSTRLHMSEMVKAHHRSAVRFLNSLYPHPYQWLLRLLLRFGLTTRSALQQLKYRPKEGRPTKEASF